MVCHDEPRGGFSDPNVVDIQDRAYFNSKEFDLTSDFGNESGRGLLPGQMRDREGCAWSKLNWDKSVTALRLNHRCNCGDLLHCYYGRATVNITALISHNDVAAAFAFSKSSKAKRDMKKTKSKLLIDEYIGSRIREGRLSLNMSQEQLAQALGVSSQQIQNYEKGVNGVSAVCLFDISKLLNISLSSMFPPKALHHPLQPQYHWIMKGPGVPTDRQSAGPCPPENKETRTFASSPMRAASRDPG